MCYCTMLNYILSLLHRARQPWVSYDPVPKVNIMVCHSDTCLLTFTVGATTKHITQTTKMIKTEAAWITLQHKSANFPQDKHMVSSICAWMSRAFALYLSSTRPLSLSLFGLLNVNRKHQSQLLLLHVFYTMQNKLFNHTTHSSKEVW